MSSVAKRVITDIFADRYRGGDDVRFTLDDVRETAAKHGAVKNLYDLIYSIGRTEIPEEIRRTAGLGRQWIIRTLGTNQYSLEQWICDSLNPELVTHTERREDRTPRAVYANHAVLKRKKKGGNEQSFLTRIRYNNLLSHFFELRVHHQQSHFKTSTDDLGMLEIDDVYVADSRQRDATRYVIPVEAKLGKDNHNPAQIIRGYEGCLSIFTGQGCLPVAAMTSDQGAIVLAELKVYAGWRQLRVGRQVHYVLSDDHRDEDQWDECLLPSPG